MKRLEENRNLIDTVTKEADKMPYGRYEEIVAFNLGAIATILTDISKSLAVLANKVESEEK